MEYECISISHDTCILPYIVHHEIRTHVTHFPYPYKFYSKMVDFVAADEIFSNLFAESVNYK